MEAEIAELEDLSPSCHNEAANPVNVDKNTSNCETESAPTSSVTREKSGSETLEETTEENVEPTVALTSPSLYIENES